MRGDVDRKGEQRMVDVVDGVYSVIGGHGLDRVDEWIGGRRRELCQRMRVSSKERLAVLKVQMKGSSHEER